VTNSAPPIALRHLDNPGTTGLIELLATFEDLQTVLRCCERLMDELKADEPDDIVLEGVWTLALLSYARGFTARPSGPPLKDADLSAVQPHGDVLEWHRMFIRLQQHHGHQIANPRERFTIGVAGAEDGAAAGIGVTSMRQPSVDQLTVRQLGAIAFSLSPLVDERIRVAQEAVFVTAQQLTEAQLAQLPRLPV
jgi:hypothetical protein